MSTPADLEMVEWAGKVIENDAGYLRYSAIHAWDGDHALCGARPAGEWVAECDSGGDMCKRCDRLERYSR